jgi:hypothetical protein
MRVHTASVVLAVVTGISATTYAQSTEPVLKLPNEIEFKAPVGPGAGHPKRGLVWRFTNEVRHERHSGPQWRRACT